MQFSSTLPALASFLVCGQKDIPMASPLLAFEITLASISDSWTLALTHHLEMISSLPHTNSPSFLNALLRLCSCSSTTIHPFSVLTHLGRHTWTNLARWGIGHVGGAAPNSVSDWSSWFSHWFLHMIGPAYLGQLLVTDGWLGQGLTFVSSFSSINAAFPV